MSVYVIRIFIHILVVYYLIEKIHNINALHCTAIAKDVIVVAIVAVSKNCIAIAIVAIVVAITIVAAASVAIIFFL